MTYFSMLGAAATKDVKVKRPATREWTSMMGYGSQGRRRNGFNVGKYEDAVSAFYRKIESAPGDGLHY